MQCHCCFFAATHKLVYNIYRGYMKYKLTLISQREYNDINKVFVSEKSMRITGVKY